MVSAIASAVSGFSAATDRLNKAAQNIAKANTNTTQSPPSSSLTQSENSDPAQQLIQANIASYDAKANLSVIKVEQKNSQSLLDITG